MPVYSLDSVRIAVGNGKIEYRGRKVQQDIANLEYELVDVKNCLLSLMETDFHKSHSYKNGQPPDDAYKISFKKPLSEVTDHLYIKFRLVDDYLCIDLGSFHL